MHNNENDELVNSFLNRTFFNSWKTNNPALVNFSAIELMINAVCDLSCDYCYFARYGNKLYPPKISKPETILKNLKIMLNWLIKNKYKPDLQIFTGELFAQKVGIDALNMVYDAYKQAPSDSLPISISIATNFTFILDEDRTNYVRDMIKKFRDIGIRLGLSASVDGKYMEYNRKKKAGDYNRDDIYYDRVFEFAKEFGYGFHPMIYSKNIDKWIDNFLWYQDMFKKHKIPPHSLYLLEVRNAEWSKDEIITFGKFITFLINWSYKTLCNSNFRAYKDFIFKDKGFNILSSPLNTVGRGLGCGIEGTFYVRLGDLNIVPCHRTMYPEYTTAVFKVEGDEIIGIEAKNPELMIGIYSFNSDMAPMCSICPIKSVCSKGCLGSQYETTGDLFSPIPTVCQLEHEKIRAMVRAYSDLGIFENIKSYIASNKIEAFETILKLDSRRI